MRRVGRCISDGQFGPTWPLETRLRQLKVIHERERIPMFTRAQLLERIDLPFMTNRRRKVCKMTQVDFVDLYFAQSGRCAFTAQRLELAHGDLMMLSPDRIDSGIGYVKGNVQFVLLPLNLGKSNFSDEDFRSHLSALWGSGSRNAPPSSRPRPTTPALAS